jgi:putative Mg2+ transporter-C (MgtC) family protein
MLEFFSPINQNILSILIAALLGAFIGFERELSHKPAGLKTHMIVCIASCLLTIVSINKFSTDFTRILASIVTGVGFIVGGSIIAQGRHVQGLTTASSIWFSSILGMIVGLGEYELAIFSSVLVFFILKYLKIAEKKMKK